MRPRTDTVEIRVIEHDDPDCAWCHIRLGATPTPPVEDSTGTLFHEVCYGAMLKLRTYTRS